MDRNERREAFLREAGRLYDEAMSRAGGERAERFDDLEEQAEESGRKMARELLANRLAAEEEAMPEKVMCPECGGPMRRPKKRALRNLDTFSGPVRYERQHAICDRCKRSFSPSGPPARDSAARGIHTTHPQGM
jgi:hypothetical protein